ncbi:MAG: hypothetical protein M3144_06975 [Actinomycetota bacterium]|nr:hypothetical protein [Actinomycetota bacterium]
MFPREVHALVVLTRAGTEVTRWPLEGCGAPTLAMVDALAHLQLAAGRVGCSIELHDVSPDLARLLCLCGLEEVLAGGGGLRLEAEGEAEGLEQPRVEEVVVPDDPVA